MLFFETGDANFNCRNTKKKRKRMSQRNRQTICRNEKKKNNPANAGLMSHVYAKHIHTHRQHNTPVRLFLPFNLISENVMLFIKDFRIC